ncbi:hypothetical protein [Demequina pelophila]|uniref:hypothetical protein n=1 Tax=Demequina pelophila TaxID=1638984 RepID=UPI000783736A|nr:hypothetical protein [Demequina pelophila]
MQRTPEHHACVLMLAVGRWLWIGAAVAVLGGATLLWWLAGGRLDPEGSAPGPSLAPACAPTDPGC